MYFLKFLRKKTLKEAKIVQAIKKILEFLKS